MTKVTKEEFKECFKKAYCRLLREHLEKKKNNIKKK